MPNQGRLPSIHYNKPHHTPLQHHTFDCHWHAGKPNTQVQRTEAAWLLGMHAVLSAAEGKDLLTGPPATQFHNMQLPNVDISNLLFFFSCNVSLSWHPGT
jgi:hypothetical protein